MKIKLVNAAGVVGFNKIICTAEGQRHQCYDIGKVESALSTAFYPGDYPFVHGGVPKIAGALAFYLTQAHAFFDGNKRTAVRTAGAFLLMNGYGLRWPCDPDRGVDHLADIITACADGKVSKEMLMDFYSAHKIDLK